jgi:hypothetical protein
LPDEFLHLLNELQTALGMHVVLQRGRGLREEWDGDRRGVFAATRIFLADAGVVDAEVLADETSPARLGWVVSDVPRIVDDRLFAIQIAARSDWFDKAAGAVHENKEALKRFDKVWKLTATRLRFPVVARNVVSGAEASYPSIGYTEGAAAWSRRGGKLRQQGVENIELLVPDAPDVTSA